MLVVQVVGKHNSGKTTLIEFLARELSKRELKVGYLKHDPKGKGITDKEGSDTFRVKPFTEMTALVSPFQTTLWLKGSFDLRKVLSFFEDFDLVFVEGFKLEKGFPKILVGRAPEDAEFLEREAVLKVEGREDYPKVLTWLLKNLNEPE